MWDKVWPKSPSVLAQSSRFFFNTYEPDQECAQVAEVLLVAIAYQSGLTWDSICDWLLPLIAQNWQRMWQAPVPSQLELELMLIHLPQDKWRSRTSWPGLVWSVGRWYRRYEANWTEWLRMSAKQRHDNLEKNLFRLGRKSPSRFALRWIEYWIGMSKPAGLGLLSHPLLEDCILPWADGSNELDKNLRRLLALPYQKDLLPLERMKFFTGRCFRVWGPKEMIWIPHILLLQKRNLIQL